MSPTCCAGIAGLVEPRKAVDTAKPLPPTFLADVSVEMDPRRAREVIALIPAQRVAETARVLTERGEFVGMGRFVGFLGDDALRAAIAEIDEASLLRIAFTMEGKERLGPLVEMLPDERLRAVLRP